MDLEKNPTLNTGPLFAMTPSNGPFQPALSAAPANFSVQLSGASLIFNPSTLSFGTEPVGGAVSISGTLTNTTTSPVTLSGIAIGGTNGGDFSETNNCPATVPVASYCTVTVTFAPGAATARSAGLEGSAASSVTSAAMTGSGEAGSVGPVTLSASTLTFYYGQTPAQAVTVSNYGTAPLGIAAINVSSGFSQVNNCGSLLSGQSLCTIWVSGGDVSSNGTLTLVDSDTTDAQTVALTAYADNGGKVYNFGSVGPGLYTEYEAIFYGDGQISPGTGYGGVTGTLSGPNTGNFFPVNGEHSVFGYMSCSGPGGCDLVFELTGSSPAGWKYALYSDTVGDLGTFVGFIAGTTAYDYFSPDTLNMGSVSVGSSTTQTISLYNGSTASLTFGSTPGTFTTGVGNSNEFTLSGFGCQGGSTLSAVSYGTNPCTASVKFSPTQAGLRSTTLTVTDTAGLATSMYLYGNGTPAAPTLPATVSFGNVATGGSSTKTVTATIPNKDSAVAQVTGTGFSISGAPYCASGASTCSFGVELSPASATNYSGTLTVTDTITGSSASGILSGIGGVPTDTLSTNSVTFIPRTQGTQSLAQTVTVTNNGNAALNISSITLTGTNASSFAQSNTCVGTPVSASGGTCTISITNTPQTTGPLAALITIVSNAPSSPDSISLSGTGQ